MSSCHGHTPALRISPHLVFWECAFLQPSKYRDSFENWSPSLAFPLCVWISQLVFLTRVQAGVPSPFLSKSVLAGSQSHTQGPIPCADSSPFQGLVSEPREKPNEALHLCHPFHPAEWGPSVSPASCRPSSVCPLLLCPSPSFPAVSGTARCGISPQNSGTTNGSVAGSEAETQASPVPPAQPLLPCPAGPCDVWR